MLGLYNSADYQEGSAAIGWFNEMNFSSGSLGQANFAIGYYNTLRADPQYNALWGAILVGDQNFSEASDSWVMGKGNIGQTEAVTLGTYASP